MAMKRCVRKRSQNQVQKNQQLTLLSHLVPRWEKKIELSDSEVRFDLLLDDDKNVPDNYGKYLHNVDDSDEVNTDIIDSIPKSITSYGIPHTHTILGKKFLLKPVRETLFINLFSVNSEKGIPYQ